MFSLQSNHSKVHLEVTNMFHKWSWSCLHQPKKTYKGNKHTGFHSNRLNTAYVKGTIYHFRLLLDNSHSQFYLSHYKKNNGLHGEPMVSIFYLLLVQIYVSCFSGCCFFIVTELLIQLNYKCRTLYPPLLPGFWWKAHFGHKGIVMLKQF